MAKNKIVPIILCLLLMFGNLPFLEKVNADNGSLTISAASLNVREGPGLSYPVAGAVKKGEEYSILKEEGDWIQISLGGSKKGWVAEWFTSKVTPKQPAVSQNLNSTTGSVSANGLRVRKGPGTGFQVIGSLNSGQAVEILNSNEDWTEIRTPALQGWVSKEFIQSNNSKKQGTTAISPGTKTAGTVTATSLNVREKP